MSTAVYAEAVTGQGLVPEWVTLSKSANFAVTLARIVVAVAANARFTGTLKTSLCERLLVFRRAFPIGCDARRIAGVHGFAQGPERGQPSRLLHRIRSVHP